MMFPLDASMDGCRRLFCGSSLAIEGNGLDLSVITEMADGMQVDGPFDMVVEAGNGH